MPEQINPYAEFAASQQAAQRAAAATVPAGWYANPEGGDLHRWWDGTRWTEDTLPSSVVRSLAPAQRAPGAPHAAADAEIAPVAPAKPPRSKGKVAAIVIGSIAAVALAAFLSWSGVKAAIDGYRASSGTGASGTPLDTTVPAGWIDLPVIDGTATVAIDPAWQDISDFYGADLVEAEALETTGIAVAVEGAWLIAGDLENGGVGLFAHSVGDAGGPSSARIEARGFLSAATQGIDGVDVTSEGAVTTANGLSGYLLEYEYPLYGETITFAVGTVVDGERQLLVYSSGSEALGSGVEELRTVLDSLTFE